MSLPWFRLYRELKDDPKIGQLDDASFRVFIEAMCWACEKEDGGKTGLTEENVNWAFRRNVTDPLHVLLQVGILAKNSTGEIIIPKWETRQKRSDTSNERVRKYRDKKNVTLHETGCNRYGNGTEERRGDQSRVDKKRGDKTSRSAPLTSGVKEVFEAWNELEVVPKCLLISDKRRRILELRLKDPFFAANWRTALQKVKEASFCLGDNERGWKANFDWFIQPDSVTKAMEGKYDGTRKTNSLNPAADRRNAGTIKLAANDYGAASLRLQEKQRLRHVAEGRLKD